MGNMKGGMLTTKDHNGSQNASSLGKAKLFASEIGNRYDGSTPGSIEDSHKSVVEAIRIFWTRLKFERSIITRQEARKTNEDFTQRWVDIEIKFLFQVMWAKLLGENDD